MLSTFDEEDYSIFEHSLKDNYDCARFSIKGKLRDALLDVIDFDSGNKVVKYEFINELTTEQLKILKKTYIDGDGHGGNQFTQKCKRNFDAFLYVCSLLGDRITYKKYVNNVGFGSTQENNWVWVATIQNNPNKFCVVEKLDFNGSPKSKGGTRRKITPTFEYSGPVWCPQTEYGTFVCRRNGRIYVTGNTYKDDMISDAIENCLNYFDNFDPTNVKQNPFGYFNKICWYAFLRRLAKEKKQQYIKYKATANFGTINEEELLDLDEGIIAEIQIYDNLHEFIAEYESAAKEKKDNAVSKMKQKKGLEKFIEE
jgi:hypothetical protein